MRTGPHPWEDGWDDDGYQPQAIDALSGPFDAWRRGRRGRGGRGWRR